MQQMMAEMKAREMAMAQHGGENPYAVEYNKEQQSKLAESEAGAAMDDKAVKLDEPSMLDKAKSFSF